MIDGPNFWILVGSFAVLFLFVGECLNAYSANTPKQTASSQLFHSVMGLIGTGISVCIFRMAIFVFVVIVFFGLIILIISLLATATDMVGLDLVIFTAISFIGYTLEIFALTLAGLRVNMIAVKNRVWVGLVDLVRNFSTSFAFLRALIIPYHATTPESPFGFSFGTGKQFNFGFRPNPQKKFPPGADGLEGDFDTCPFSRGLLNPVVERSTGRLSTGIHNQMKSKTEGGEKFFGTGMEFDFTFGIDSQHGPEYRRIARY